MVRPANAMRHPTFADRHHRAAVAEVDYFRYSTMGLAVQRVIDDDIGGALAEVGVWRGEVSRFLHALAPDRHIYLFDTFEGFPSRDLDPDRPVDMRFRDTSAAAVARHVGADPNVRVRPGRVPETFAGLEDERFAFVLLDLDLYGPTLASLRFFYPRLSPAGYLIVHDYNNPESDWGCKRALDEFTSEIPERPVELADIWGSAVLRRTASRG
jgi:O-methyltransferase